MARLALYARFRRFDAEPLAQSQRPGGMTLETFQDRRTRVKSAISLSGRCPMPGSQAELSGRLIVTRALFDVILVIHAANKGHGLISGAKRPVRLDSAKSLAKRMRVEGEQRTGVRCPSLRGALGRMARRANLGPNEGLARSYPGQRKENEDSTAGYQTSLPLN